MSKNVQILEMTKNNIEFIIEEFDEPDEPTEFVKATKSQADIYYKFRYTFNDEDDPDAQKATARTIIRELHPWMKGGYFTAGIEHFKSGMIDCKPHLHVHFVSRDKKDTIIKSLKRHLGKDYFTGNRNYGCGIEVIVNEDKFWRYPLKQQKGDTQRWAWSGSFTKEQIISFTDQAYVIWITGSEVQNKKNEKKENNDQLSDRLYEYLDTNVTANRSDRTLKIAIQKFYIVEEQKPFNKTTAYGYLLNYKIMRGLMTHDELANTW